MYMEPSSTSPRAKLNGRVPTFQHISLRWTRVPPESYGEFRPHERWKLQRGKPKKVRWQQKMRKNGKHTWRRARKREGSEARIIDHGRQLRQRFSKQRRKRQAQSAAADLFNHPAKHGSKAASTYDDVFHGDNVIDATPWHQFALEIRVRHDHRRWKSLHRDQIVISRQSQKEFAEINPGLARLAP